MSLSTGSIINFVAATYDNLASAEQMIKDALKKTPVAGSNETGMRVEGEPRWLDILRDDQWTFYHLAEKVRMRRYGCHGNTAGIYWCTGS